MLHNLFASPGFVAWTTLLSFAAVAIAINVRAARRGTRQRNRERSGSSDRG